MKQNALHLTAWATLAAVVFVTVSPIELRPGDILPVDVDRALACAGLAGIFALAYPRQWPWIGLALVLGAGGTEVLQLLSPSRHARLDDAMVKAGGAALGVAIAYAVNFSLGRSRLPKRRHAPAPLRAVPSLGEIVTAFGQSKEMPVQSRVIESVFFSQEDGALRIRFRNGEERSFEGVPAQEAVKMLQAPSPGQYYIDNIRKKYNRAA